MKKEIFVRVICLFCACFLLLLGVDCFVPGNESQIYEGAVRLHVLAASDSQKDQEIKLLVRDEILRTYGSDFLNSTEPSDARDAVVSNLESIQATANSVLQSQGISYTATVRWGRETYPSRTYEGITLPEGEYYSLRVELGEAGGKNWWCVLFPPLCNGASTEKLTMTGVNKNSCGVFTKRKYIFRFKFLELFGW